jgi:EmrB/QacA subfamily drug resistance transporter
VIDAGARTDPPVPPGRTTAILLAMSGASVIGAGSATMINVALPAIGSDLHAEFSALQWIVNAFTVVAASCILPATTLGTNLGRRRMFLAGMTLIAVGCIAAAVAPNIASLIGARIVQALGSAVVGPTSLGILVHQFTGERDRQRGVGLWAAGASVGLAVGPLAAGVLIDGIGWRGVFAVVAGLAVAVGVLGHVGLSEDLHGRRRTPLGIDYVGAALAAFVLGALSYGFIEASSYGWDAPQIVGAFAVTGLGLLGFVLVEGRRERTGRPTMIGPSLWRHRRFLAADIGGAIFFFALYGNLFLFSVYCEHEFGFSPLKTGLVFLPMTALMAVLAALAGRIIGRFGVRNTAVAGFVLATIGAATLIDAGSGASPTSLAVRFALMGLGFGLVSAPLTLTAVGDIPEALREPASSTYNAVRQVGAVVSVAVLGAIAPVGVPDIETRLAAAVVLTTVLLAATAVLLHAMLRPGLLHADL